MLGLKTYDILPELTVSLIATLSSISDGMHFGWSAPLFPVLRATGVPVKLSKIDEPWLESVYPLSGLLALPLTSYMVDKIGRKNSILVASCTSLLAWIIIGCANRVEYLYCGRILSGAAGDIAYVATPMYLSEISDKKIRGFLIGLNYSLIYFGALLIYIIGPFLPYYAPSILGVTILGLQLLILPFMPSSPYFLLRVNKTDEARMALERLRPGRKNVEAEFDDIAEAVRRQNEHKGNFWDLVTVKSNRKATIIVVLLVSSQYFSGMNVMIMSFHSVLLKAKLVYVKTEHLGIIFSALMVIASVLSCATVDKFGRKPVMVISSVLTGLCLLALSIYFHLVNAGVDVDNLNWVAVISSMSYAFTLKYGLGLIPQLLVSELFSNSMRGYGMPLGDAVYIIAGSISVFFHQYLADSFGEHVPFYVFSGVAFAVGIYTILCVPETKGKTLEEIQLMLER